MNAAEQNKYTQASRLQASLPPLTNSPQSWAGLSETPLRLLDEPLLRPRNAHFVSPALASQAKEPRPAATRHFALLILLVALCAASYYLVSRYVVTAVVVQGRSMAPTLRDGEHYFLNRWLYLLKPPQRGDVVVIRDPGHQDYAVKRIVAGPSDRLRFTDGKLFLNGKKLNEPYLAEGTSTLPSNNLDRSIKIEANKYFVMGDNRAYSEDSRAYGQVSRDQIVGLICK